MYNKSNIMESGVLKSICVAAVQFPFIPVIHHPEMNWLSEPEGGINNWLIGKKAESNFPDLSSLQLPEDYEYYKDRIKEYLSSGYQDWLVLTVKGILDSIIKTREDVDIILFPEYSLPLEINKDLRRLLRKCSEGRCIVGGIGSVCKNAKEDKKNRFVVANNGKLVCGEKVVPNDIERGLGIVGGEGYLIHKVKLNYTKEQDRELYIEILMCSDCIEKVKSGSKVQNQLNEECSDKEIESGIIGVSLIPAFSTKTEDMASIAEICALRFYTIAVLANCSFFGGSCIWYPPITRDTPRVSSQKVQKGKSACVIVDIPTTFLGRPVSTPVEINTIASPETVSNRHPLIFKDERTEEDFGFDLDSVSLFSLITERLSSAITLSGIAFARSPIDRESTEFVRKSSIHWKKLQDAINSFAGHSGSSYESVRSSDIIAFHEMMGEENLYKLILNKLQDHLPDDTYKTKVQEIMDYMEDTWIIPPAQWQYNEKQYQR